MTGSPTGRRERREFPRNGVNDHNRGMLVAHVLTTRDRRLALWAEDSTRPYRAVTRTNAVTDHPFAVPAPVKGTPDRLSLTLPSRGGAPLPSPELIRDSPALRGAPRLRVWLVPVTLVEPADAVATLAELSAMDLRRGADVRFLCSVAELAADLVDRGRVLPTVVDGVARWRAVTTGADAVRAAGLTAALPPALRALNRPASAVFTEAMDLFTDAEVRRRVPVTGGHPFLQALTGEPSTCEDRLGERLERWQGAVQVAGAVRVCFRLRAPDQRIEDDAWAVEFLLQAVEDPSVLVPASAVWAGGDTVLYRWVDNPAEELLRGLGRAVRLLPALDRALDTARPTELVLDTEGAHTFLTTVAALDQAGFGVLLPSWWHRRVRLGLTLTASTVTPGAVARPEESGLRAIMGYRWELAVGDDPLTAEELAELAAAKDALVRLRGQWVHLDRRALTEGLRFLACGNNGRMTAADVLRAAVDPEATPLPVTNVVADGWLGELLSGRADRRLEPVVEPASFGTVLRPYQRRGLAWLSFMDSLNIGGCLADDMGLGKTVQVLALEALRRDGRRRPPTLLICPMSVVGNWRRETARLAPSLRVLVHHGPDRATEADFTADGHDLVITTYALAARDAVLRRVNWDRVVLDEAQMIKNSGTRQSRAVRAIPARQRLALTGTPVENRLADLWSIMDFTNPGLLGGVNTFRARYAVPVERHGDTDAAGRLRRVTAPFILRRVKDDPTIISDLPEKTEIIQYCNLTAEQASLYQAVVNEMTRRIDQAETGREGLVLATMSKLKQICDHPAQFLADGSPVAGRSGKLIRLEEILAEILAEGDKVLCFTQFARFGAMLRPYLATRFDTEVLYLHGGTSAGHRDGLVRRFQRDDGPSILLLSLTAGGTGLNLTAANQVIHLDRWWNPSVEQQATDRAFRIGQRRHVQVRPFVCLGTLEERIDAMIEEKKALSRLVVGGGESWLARLSTEAIRELIALEPEAVIE